MTSSRSVAGEATTFGFADALVRCAHMIDHVFAEVAREQGLTPQHAQLICLLTRGPLPMRELATLLGLEKSGITGLVDRAEQRGLVARRPDPNDRRAWDIELTTEGATKALNTHATIGTRLDALGADLSPRSRAHLVNTTTRLLSAHTAATGRPWGVRS